MKNLLVAMSLVVASSVALQEEWDDIFPKTNQIPVVGILAIPPEDSSTEYNSYI